MTQAEKIVAAVVIGLIALALLLPAEQVELALTVQVVALGAVALVAGLYVWRSTRGIKRSDSEYLWLLVKRDIRVTLGGAMLGVLALAVLVPRVLGWDETIFQRPWAVLWLVIAIDLFAVGLIDDALIVRRDRRAKP